MRLQFRGEPVLACRRLSSTRSTKQESNNLNKCFFFAASLNCSSCLHFLIARITHMYYHTYNTVLGVKCRASCMITKHSRNLAASPAVDYRSMNTAEKSEPNQEQTFFILLKLIASAINLGQQSVLMHLFRQHLKKGHLPIVS